MVLTNRPLPFKFLVSAFHLSSLPCVRHASPIAPFVSITVILIGEAYKIWILVTRQFSSASCNFFPLTPKWFLEPPIQLLSEWSFSAVILNRRAAARYLALASIIPGRGRPEENTICYKISLVQLITNLNVILYLSTCHTVYISVLILFIVLP